MFSGYYVFFEMFREYNMLNFKIKIVIKCYTFLLVNQQTSKFTRSSDIPVEFIRKNGKLRGRLCWITENGLEIEYTPITLPVISSWRKEPCGVLLIKLTGVELIETGKGWLQKELKPSEVLWFQLLGKDNSALFCYLLVNKPWSCNYWSLRPKQEKSPHSPQPEKASHSKEDPAQPKWRNKYSFLKINVT